MAVAVEEFQASMSSAEARDRLVAAMLAQRFIEEQLSLLRNARIEDDDGSVELASSMENVTPQQVGEHIKLMLEANPSLLGEDLLADLGKTLGRSQASTDPVPLRSDQIQEVLRRTEPPQL
jgi:hypothetical protein